MPQPHNARQTPLSNHPVGAIVGEFIEEKNREIREERDRQKPRRRNPLVLPLLVALCLAVWVAPSLMPPRETALTPEVLERGARLNLYLASLRIRQYQTTHKQLPAHLGLVGVDTTGITYVRVGNGAFELSSQVLGARMVYRSTQPDSLFLGRDLRIRGIR
jgi:hypothetical protein